MRKRGAGSAGGSARIRAGYQALGAGAWAKARREFEAALAAGETPEALEGLGRAAWWMDDAETVFRAREQAYRLYRRRGDKRSAARLAIALAEDSLYFRGEPAVAQGWHLRAGDLLQDLGPLTPEHGWLKLSEGDFALTFRGDPAASSSRAREAMEIGQSLGVEEIRILARALEGAALVAEGRVDDGMSSLDGAVTAALSGELEDPVAIGYSCCYMLNACERARDFDRAIQWCVRVKAFSEQKRFNALLAICRTQHASVLIGRGEWRAAEDELQVAARQFAASRPALQGEAMVRLAGLRRRQGRFEEAANLLEQTAGHPLALLEQAALALDQSDARAALQLAERFLRRVPERNQVDRLAGQEVALRAHLALGNRKQAAAVMAELRSAAGGSGAVMAAVSLAEGLVAVAGGDHEPARRSLEDAVDLFSRCGALFDAARSRMELARVFRSAGQRDAALAEARAALTVLDRLGAENEARRVAKLLGELSSQGEIRGGGQPGGLSPREVEVLRLVAQGLSNSQVAARLHVSEFTVKRHVQNILTRLDLPTRAAASAYAVRHGLV